MIKIASAFTILLIATVSTLPQKPGFTPKKMQIEQERLKTEQEVIAASARTLDCRNTNKYSFVVVVNPKRKKDTDPVIPKDLNIVLGKKLISTIELPKESEVKNFSLNSIKKKKSGFEINVNWGGGVYHYEVQFNFKCKETGFYLYRVTTESFSTSNPDSGTFLDKKELKVTKIEPNLPIEKFIMIDYL